MENININRFILRWAIEFITLALLSVILAIIPNWIIDAIGTMCLVVAGAFIFSHEEYKLAVYLDKDEEENDNDQ